MILKRESTSAMALVTTLGQSSVSSLSSMAFLLCTDVVIVANTVQWLWIFPRMRELSSSRATPCRSRDRKLGKSRMICRTKPVFSWPICSRNKAICSKSHSVKFPSPGLCWACNRVFKHQELLINAIADFASKAEEGYLHIGGCRLRVLASLQDLVKIPSLRELNTSHAKALDILSK